jgi:omega-amidase
MNANLKITLVQCDLHWENRALNCESLEKQLSQIAEPTDVVVLCEMFTTGFSMSAEHIAEPMSSTMPTLIWMQKWAAQLQACITGSVSVTEGSSHFNRLFWVYPDGGYRCYDKRHTFTFAGEDRVYQRGANRLLVEWKGWRILPLVCYDLRFPIWSKNRIVAGQPAYDLLLYVANWPSVRREPWNILLQARAIENQCYVGAVNRVGTDDNGLAYSGDSVVLNARGEHLADAISGSTCLISAELDAAALHDFRAKFPVLWDDDDDVQLK